MLEITSTRFCHPIFNHRAFSMTHHVLTHPQQNGVAKRKNGHLLNTTLIVVFKLTMKFLWAGDRVNRIGELFSYYVSFLFL